MRVLMIGYFRESSGWGTAARDYALALDAVGIDVAIRCINLGNSNFQLPPKLVELENRPSVGAEICIQHLLPHHMQFSGGFKRNIGLFVCETSNFAESTWADQLNLMDEVIVPCMDNRNAARNSGVTVPIHIIPHATDITRFERGYGVLEQLKPYKDQGSFIFYMVGEWIRRKNTGALLRAFHTEFDPDENVELVIKSNVPGLSPAQGKARIESACNEIKDALKLHGEHRDSYKQEIVITERLTEEGMMKLHATCDCFVLPSHGEAWCIPAFDSMAMGKTPIVSNTGCWDFVGVSESLPGGWIVDSFDSQVFGVNDSFGDLFTGREEWKDVNHRHLRTCMREAFQNKEGRAARSETGRENAYQFTYEQVGLQFKKVLHEQQETRYNDSTPSA